MNRFEEARKIIERQIAGKEEMIIGCMENIERYAKKMMCRAEDNELNNAIGYAESIGRMTKEIEELQRDIRELRNQLSLIGYLDRKEG